MWGTSEGREGEGAVGDRAMAHLGKGQGPKAVGSTHTHAAVVGLRIARTNGKEKHWLRRLPRETLGRSNLSLFTLRVDTVRNPNPNAPSHRIAGICNFRRARSLVSAVQFMRCYTVSIVFISASLNSDR